MVLMPCSIRAQPSFKPGKILVFTVVVERHGVVSIQERRATRIGPEFGPNNTSLERALYDKDP